MLINIEKAKKYFKNPKLWIIAESAGFISFLLVVWVISTIAIHYIF